jgi:hypothetical protein
MSKISRPDLSAIAAPPRRWKLAELALSLSMGASFTDAERIHFSCAMSNFPRKVFTPEAPGGRGILVEFKDQKTF